MAPKVRSAQSVTWHVQLYSTCVHWQQHLGFDVSRHASSGEATWEGVNHGGAGACVVPPTPQVVTQQHAPLPWAWQVLCCPDLASHS